jgi:hypothetical protein
VKMSLLGGSRGSSRCETVSLESEVCGWRSAARVSIVQSPGITHCRVFCGTRFDFETAEHSAVKFHTNR